MNRPETAVAYFKSGYVCSQSILASFAADLGLSRELAFKIACPFGAGIARSGDICGAVSGALMVIGLKYGLVNVDNPEAKEKTYALVHEFMNRFRAHHGTIMCHELLEFEKGDLQGVSRAKEAGIADERCSDFVKTAAEILEAIL